MSRLTARAHTAQARTSEPLFWKAKREMPSGMISSSWSIRAACSAAGLSTQALSKASVLPPHHGFAGREDVLLGEDHAGGLVLNGLDHSWVAVAGARDPNACIRSAL